ncbi:crk-like protein [Lampetra fluviatilis]
MCARFEAGDARAWYAGPLSRREAHARLAARRAGTFLVRDSVTSPGDFVLSVREAGARVSHYIVSRLPAARAFRIGDRHFRDLPSLLLFYAAHHLDTTTLREPAGGGAPPPCQQVPPALASAPMDYVQALYDFAGSDAEDLPFQRGEVLLVLDRPEEQWWTARNRAGRAGMIPVPYVERWAPPLPPAPTPQPHRGGRGPPEPVRCTPPTLAGPPPANGSPPTSAPLGDEAPAELSGDAGIGKAGNGAVASRLSQDA